MPAVSFQLCFTRTTCTDWGRAAGSRLPDKVRPHTGEAWKQIFILSQLNLKLTFPCLCALGKNIKDEAGTVKNLDAEFLAEYTHLGRGELVVKHCKVAVIGLNEVFHLTHFPLADEAVGVRRRKILHDHSNRFAACSLHKRGKFLHADVGRAFTHFHAESAQTGKDSAFLSDGGFVHRASR